MCSQFVYDLMGPTKHFNESVADLHCVNPTLRSLRAQVAHSLLRALLPGAFFGDELWPLVRVACLRADLLCALIASLQAAASAPTRLPEVRTRMKHSTSDPAPASRRYDYGTAAKNQAHYGQVRLPACLAVIAECSKRVHSPRRPSGM